MVRIVQALVKAASPYQLNDVPLAVLRFEVLPRPRLHRVRSLHSDCAALEALFAQVWL